MNRTLLRLGLIIAPIVVSLAITSIFVLLVGSNPLAVAQTILEGAFRDSRSFAGVINYWIPLALCSMGLIVTFTAGLWNIGVEGQMVMGAIAASFIARSYGDSLPNTVLIPLEMIAAMLGGGLWATVVGVLKIKLGVHEIFGGVALNSLANVYSIYLIAGPWAPSTGGTAQATPPFPDASLYPRMSADFPISLIALIAALAATVIVILALRGTRWGLQLKATGKNAKSALLLGVPTAQSALTAFIVCGVLAGIAGSYRALLTYGSLRPLVSGGIGFLALLVVLLTSNRALIVPLIAFLFAVLWVGVTRLRVVLQLDQSLAGVLQGFVVLLVLLSNGLRQRLEESRERNAHEH